MHLSDFLMHDEWSIVTTKQIFDFELSTKMQEVKLGPGDVLSVSPIITSLSTESMHVLAPGDEANALMTMLDIPVAEFA